MTVKDQDSPASLKILWDDAALDLLAQWDRFTYSGIRAQFREAIRDEFNGAASSQFISFDTERSGYITPVLDHRYSVVWYHRKDQNAAEVSAVVPTTRFGSDDLKKRVQSVVRIESNGKINLP